MKNNIFPLATNQLYHIYNRGINGGALFFEHENYFYFLKLISEKINPIAEIWSYCLLQNHFHVLVKIKSEGEIREIISGKEFLEIEKIISQQFSNTFNSYSQAINKRFGRTGKLFELPFRRKDIITENQLLNTILYINKNPAKHKISGNFLDYNYSSAKSIICNENSFVESAAVLSLFENTENFIFCLNNYRV